MSLAFFTRTRTGEVQSRIANDTGDMHIAMTILDWRLTIAASFRR